MATNYGLTGTGFVIPGMADLVEETKKSFKTQFGEDFNTESNSVADKLISVFSEREYQIWLGMGSVYYAQTMQGAEGIYLDDLLGKRGVYRRGKTRGTGSVAMTVDATVPYNTVYPKTNYTVDSDFEFTSDYQVAGNVIAQLIKSEDLVVGNYRLSIENSTTAQVVTLNYNLTATTGGALTAFFGAIKDFIVDNTIASNADRIIIDSSEGAIYIGYDSNKRMIGLSTRVDFRTNPLAGQKTILMDVRSIDPGPISRDAHSVINISPVPLGFVAIDNLTAFIDGSDVESDNEYKLRATQVMNEGKATRPAILSALLNKVEGIEKVRIFNNNTDATNSIGIPPYRFMVVCYGGSTEQISTVLYDTIAASNNTYGNTFFDVPTEDDQVERIYHTKAIARELEIRVRYRGRPLSITEETQISESLAQQVNSTQIAGTLYNVQLVGTVVTATTAGRFTQVFVDIKNKGEPDSAYVNTDVQADITEVFSIDPADVSFSQII